MDPMVERDDRSRSEDLFRELLSRRESGENVDPEEYYTRYPELEGELRSLFAKFDAGAADMIDLLGNPNGTAENRTPQVIGDYRIIREIGKGGMGAVYEAEQISLKRKVALKLLPHHLSFSDEAVQKFRREAEAGGRQSHPGIVAIHAIGEHEGVHFIAQELVDGGRTLADFIFESRQKTELPASYYRKVAVLFVELAEALQHAHNRGVVHRDMKPSNILLSTDGTPKVTDFGLAKVEDALALSRTGDFAGTPYYMSPEQAMSRRIGIDHRTDIFSLGATLYETLTFARAFDGDSSRQVLEKITLSDPPDPRRIRSKTPRDLAVICLKALEKKRKRRYQTMNELADDLRRFLNNEPVLAKPAGLSRRAAKWSLRHPVLAVAGTVVVLSLIVIVGLLLRITEEQKKTSTALHNTQIAERKALAKAKIAEEEQLRSAVALEWAQTAERDANEKLEMVQSVLDFLEKDVLRQADPYVQAKPNVTLRDAIEMAGGRMEGRLGGQPFVEAQVRFVLGRVLQNLGHFELAEQHLNRAAQLHEIHFDRDDPVVLVTRTYWFSSLVALGRPNEAFAIFEEMISRNLSVDLVLKVLSEHDLSSTIKPAEHPWWSFGRYPDLAIFLLYRLVDRVRENFGDESIEVALALRYQALVELPAGKIGAARKSARGALDIYEKICSSEHELLLVADGHYALANILSRQNEWVQAEIHFRECLQIRKRIFKESSHPDLAYALLGVYLAQLEQARGAEAEGHLGEGLSILRELYGHASSAEPRFYGLLIARGRYAEAEKLLREAIDLRRNDLGGDHLGALVFIHLLGEIHCRQDRPAEAERLFREVLATRRCVLGESHPDTLRSKRELGLLLESQGKSEEAELFLRDE